MPGIALGVLDVLGLAGLRLGPKARFVRHQTEHYPIDELRRSGWFELYQSYQRRPVFHGVEELVAFYGLTGTRAGLHGVYHVRGVRGSSEGPVPAGCPWVVEWQGTTRHFYDLERESRFDSLRDRIVIDWGRATRAWVQKPGNKEVLSILEPGRRLPPFEDYLEFSLTYDQLRDLFASEEAHQEWRAQLRAVGGVYLILDESTGALYVGSASGEEGIWGRWREYARTGHGGNAKLIELIGRDGAYQRHFRFSILQILPKTLARDRMLERETLYKHKLGSRRTIGLNVN